MSKDTPRWPSHCFDCKFLCRSGGCDLYVCYHHYNSPELCLSRILNEYEVGHNPISTSKRINNATNRKHYEKAIYVLYQRGTVTKTEADLWLRNDRN